MYFDNTHQGAKNRSVEIAFLARILQYMQINLRDTAY